MSRRSMATTLPEVLSSSSLPSTTKLAGATKPLTESRSCFRTMTFLWVEDIGHKGFPKRFSTIHPFAKNANEWGTRREGLPRWDSRTFLVNSGRLSVHSSQTVNVVLFSLVYFHSRTAVQV